jgi:glucose/arabinose dehydrogenase
MPATRVPKMESPSTAPCREPAATTRRANLELVNNLMRNRRSPRPFIFPLVAAFFSAGAVPAARSADDSAPATTRVLTGQDALGDWTTDAPGVRRRITLDDLARPYATRSANNFPSVVRRPEGAWPQAPEGFHVGEFAGGLRNPRKIVTAPNGDVFVAESFPGRIKVLRDADGDGKAELIEDFATRLRMPFGIAFYPEGPSPTHVYVANTDSVVRFPYQNGDTKASGPPEVLVKNIPSGSEQVGGGGHWTRDVVFSKDGKTLFVSVGSRSNVSDDQRETRRADILAFNPDGKHERIYAWGLRNAVGLAVQPETGQLWASVNERDLLGDNLVPDYVTHIEEGGFYGWPWYYLGGHEDPRHKGKHPELKDKAIVPDVLVQSHSASLCMTFYTGSSFATAYRNDAFASEHGSWNRTRRTGYKVIRIPMKDGKATGEYEDFLVGFVTKEGNVWGRPVGVAVAKDGALLVTDDGSNTVWRVSASPAR